MPSPSFVIFEIGLYVLAVLCLIHAWRRGLHLVLGIVAGCIHGFVTENVAITRLHEYYYNRFLIMLCSNPGGWGVAVKCVAPNGCVPLVVPLLEGVLIYAAMSTTDQLNLSWRLRPLLDGLLAMTIDFALDPVVSIGTKCLTADLPQLNLHGLGFWIWQVRPPQEATLGVNLNNFAGWFLGTAVFSFVLRACRRWIQPRWPGLAGKLAAALAAVVATQLVLFVVVEIYTLLVNLLFGQQWIVFSIMIAAAVLVLLRGAAALRHDSPIDWTLLAVPGFLMLFTLGALLLSGLYQLRPLLLALWLVLFVIAGIGFTLPYWQRSAARQSSGSSA